MSYRTRNRNKQSSVQKQEEVEDVLEDLHQSFECYGAQYTKGRIRVYFELFQASETLIRLSRLVNEMQGKLDVYAGIGSCLLEYMREEFVSGLVASSSQRMNILDFLDQNETLQFCHERYTRLEYILKPYENRIKAHWGPGWHSRLEKKGIAPRRSEHTWRALAKVSEKLDLQEAIKELIPIIEKRVRQRTGAGLKECVQKIDCCRLLHSLKRDSTRDTTTPKSSRATASKGKTTATKAVRPAKVVKAAQRQTRRGSERPTRQSPRIKHLNAPFEVVINTTAPDATNAVDTTTVPHTVTTTAITPATTPTATSGTTTPPTPLTGTMTDNPQNPGGKGNGPMRVAVYDAPDDDEHITENIILGRKRQASSNLNTIQENRLKKLFRVICETEHGTPRAKTITKGEAKNFIKEWARLFDLEVTE